jgi:tripartite-type tricarboxylate transporter receptor subunit TctC
MRRILAAVALLFAALPAMAQEYPARPDVRKQLLERGIDASPSSGAELAACMRSESDKWVPLAKSPGLQSN